MVVMQLWVWLMVASGYFGGYFNRLCDGGCWVVLTSYGYCCVGWLWQLVVAWIFVDLFYVILMGVYIILMVDLLK